MTRWSLLQHFSTSLDRQCVPPIRRFEQPRLGYAWNRVVQVLNPRSWTGLSTGWRRVTWNMARTRDGYDAVRGAPAANHLCPPHLSRGRSQQIFPSKSVSNNIRGPATPRGIADATQPPHISTHESSFNDPPPPLLPYNKLHRFSLIRLALFIPRAYLQGDKLIERLFDERDEFRSFLFEITFSPSSKTRNISALQFSPFREN